MVGEGKGQGGRGNRSQSSLEEIIFILYYAYTFQVTPSNVGNVLCVLLCMIQGCYVNIVNGCVVVAGPRQVISIYSYLRTACYRSCLACGTWGRLCWCLGPRMGGCSASSPSDTVWLRLAALCFDKLTVKVTHQEVVYEVLI